MTMHPRRSPDAACCAGFKRAALSMIEPVLKQAELRETLIRYSCHIAWYGVTAFGAFALLHGAAPAAAAPCAVTALVAYPVTDHIARVVSVRSLSDGAYDDALEMAAAALALACALCTGTLMAMNSGGFEYSWATLGAPIAFGAVVILVAPHRHMILASMTRTSDAQKLRETKAVLSACPATGCGHCPVQLPHL